MDHKDTMASLDGPDPKVPSPPATAGLYLHIPFCRSKCGYCSFTSFPCAAPPAAYLAALQQQLAAMARHPAVRELAFATLFVGGGTPTIYEAAPLAELIRTGLRLLPLAGEPEISLETNPNTVSLDKLRTLRAAGANRLSIGVQSFSDRLLTACGRTHTGAQAVQAFRWARQAGFDNCSLDLIYGLPGQELAAWEESLAAALELGPEHLSLYELSVEENTGFAVRAARGELELPAEELVLEMADLACQRLAAAGYRRYEISNFARPGRECRHNLLYWHNRDYLGLGAGAVSFLAGIRIRNVDDPELYGRLVREGRPPFQEAECLDRAASFRETVIMGLRLLGGVDLEELRQRFDTTPQAYYGPVLERLLAQGLVRLTPHRLQLTERALPVANRVLAELV